MKHVYLLLDSATFSGREIHRGIFAYAKKTDWVIEFDNRGLGEMPLEHSLDRNWDGVIMRSVLPEVRDQIIQRGFVNVELLGSQTNSIQYDMPKIVDTAVRFMLDTGETRLGYYTAINAYWNSWAEQLLVERAKKDGFPMFLYTSSYKTTIAHAFAYRSPEMEQRCIEWVDSLPKPIGIMAPFPFFAARIVNVCKNLGLSIPSQVSILTASNDEQMCETITPSLSCVRLNSYQFGYEAAQLLDRKMNGLSLPEEQTFVPPKGIVVRNSTRGGLAQNPDILRAVQLIRENAGALNVQDLIDQLSISRRTLEREFLRILGRTPKAEIDRVQMQSAVRLLTTTNLSVNEVSRRCGFSSPVYFSISFRRRYGISPLKYRKDNTDS